MQVKDLVCEKPKPTYDWDYIVNNEGIYQPTSSTVLDRILISIVTKGNSVVLCLYEGKIEIADDRWENERYYKITKTLAVGLQ